MMELTPREVAATDQELAGFTESLTMLVDRWPQHLPDEPRAIRVATYARHLSTMTPWQVANLLALAIERATK